ncbi:MAG: hypothetical protein MUP58_02720 [Candidatus Nanohaloarchaeota archaeon QJJ-9]|nr:hypothetical protein [Candidatus Nanohaloarchaeota archaeon QJJ-9]
MQSYSRENQEMNGFRSKYRELERGIFKEIKALKEDLNSQEVGSGDYCDFEIGMEAIKPEVNCQNHYELSLFVLENEAAGKKREGIAEVELYPSKLYYNLNMALNSSKEIKEFLDRFVDEKGLEKEVPEFLT